MKKLIYVAIVLFCLSGGVLYRLFSHTAGKDMVSAAASRWNGQSSSTPAPQQIPAPPQPQAPPPPPPFGALKESPTEPSRALVGFSAEQLKEVERFLPKGAHIAISPISNTAVSAALVNLDLDGDRVPETITVYADGTTPTGGAGSLTLAVLSRQGQGEAIRASIQLPGTMLFNLNVNGAKTPLVVGDVTGDKRPEIIVASGFGASAGGALQVLSLEGTTFRQIGEIGGNFFTIQSGAPGKSAVITAQSRYQASPEVYQWNGQRFSKSK